METRYRDERETTLELLRLLNDDNNTHELVRSVTGFLQQWTGCEAVGVRLRDGDDFPYFETRGFPPEFVQMENQLCLRDADGDVVRDSHGQSGPGVHVRQRPLRAVQSGPAVLHREGQLLDQRHERTAGQHQRGRPPGPHAQPLQRRRLRIGGLGRLAPWRRNARPAANQPSGEEAALRPRTIIFLENAADQIAMALAQRQSHAALRESEQRFRSLFENMLNGFAYCRMLFDEGRPQDFIYLAVNNAFETLTGLKNVVGKKVSEVIPGLRQSDPELFEIYGRVALTGVPESFETYVDALDTWFAVSVYSPSKEHFVAVFDVITERKRAEAALASS